MAHHYLRAVLRIVFCEIGSEPFLQVLRLTDIDRHVFIADETVHAGFIGKGRGNFFEVAERHYANLMAIAVNEKSN